MPRETRSLARMLVMSSPANVTMPVRTVHEAKERLEERRLAGAVGADDADEFALADLHGAAVEDVDAGRVARVEVVGGDDDFCLDHERSSNRSVSW